MEMHEFEIEIGADGDVRVHIKGVKGKRCLEYAEFLKQIIGPVRKVQHTNEFYEPDSKVRLDLEQKQGRRG
jgi:hypothetical protein